MTREEAKKMFREDVDAYGKPKKIMTKIDKIFDYFENRSCENCKYYKKSISQDYETCFLIKNNGYNLDCDKDFCCNRWENKE